MIRSLKTRLVIAFTAVGLGAAAITALVVHLAFSAQFNNYLSAQQKITQQNLIHTLVFDYQNHHGWKISSLNHLDMYTMMNNLDVEVLNNSGKLVWSSKKINSYMPMSREMSEKMLSSTRHLNQESIPLFLGKSHIGTALIRLPQLKLPAIDQAFEKSVENLILVASLAAGMIAIIIGITLARKIVAPVQSLTNASLAMSKGQYSARLKPSIGELGEMAVAFNTMATTIETQERLRYTFSRDIAHELRTPLMILQGQIEALQDGLIPSSEETLSSLHNEILRLTRLVADLETMASADSAGFSLHNQIIYLDELVEQTLADFHGPLKEANLFIKSQLDEHVEVLGDPNRLHQIFTNLLSNATKFVPPGGTIEITLKNNDSYAHLSISDNGPGIEELEIPFIFDRFFRGKGVKSTGSGIGLAVVADLVQAHNGEISVESKKGHGTTFLLRFPKTPQNLHNSFTSSSYPNSKVLNKAK